MALACKAQMSMKSDSLLCHRRSGVTCLCDLRPCLAGHKKMLLHHSPYLPTCKTKANERAFAAEEPRHTPGIIPFSVCPIIRCPQTRCMEQLPLSSKQALRDSSGSLKERTEEPLGSLNKVYRAHFAWPTL